MRPPVPAAALLALVAGCIEPPNLGRMDDLLQPAEGDGDVVAAGAPSATCALRIGGPGNVVDWSTTWDASAGHTTGRWYFEVTVELFEEGWASFGVAAAPNDVPTADPFTDAPQGAAVFMPERAHRQVGVAVDLDADVVEFIANGGVVATREILSTPGLGAYVPGALPMTPVRFVFNFGEQPFALGLPEGFMAFASGLAADEDGDCVSEGGTANVEAAVDATCADEQATSHRTDADGEDELIVVGIYQSAQSVLVDEESWTWRSVEGETRVLVDRPGKMVTVAVSSYEPTHWIVEAGADTTIAAVLLNGYEEQRATVPDGATTTTLDLDDYAYAWPSGGDGDTQKVVAAFEDETGLRLTAFAGCYEGTSFSFGPDA